MQRKQEEEKVKLKDRVRKHKKLLIGGVFVVGSAIVAFINRDYLAEKLFDNADEIKKAAVDAMGKKPLDKISLDTAISTVQDKMSEGASRLIDINRHLRKLPEGWHASKEKMAEALELGIDLLPGFTLVDGYQKSMPA